MLPAECLRNYAAIDDLVIPFSGIVERILFRLFLQLEEDPLIFSVLSGCNGGIILSDCQYECVATPPIRGTSQSF